MPASKKVTKHSSKHNFTKILFLALFALLALFFYKSSPASVEKVPEDIIYSKQLLNTTSSSRGGVWTYNKTTKTEKQIASLKDLANVKQEEEDKVYNLYSESISPDKTKLAISAGYSKYGEENKKYNLWVLDLLTGERKQLAFEIGLPEGYIEAPIWRTDSKSFYLPLVEKGVNKLYEFNINGLKKPVSKTYEGNFHWTIIIDENTLAFAPSIPQSREIGFLNLKKDEATFIDDFSTYYADSLVKLSEDILVKSESSTLQGNGPTQKDFIDGLDLVNLSSKQITPINVPSSFKFSPGIKRLGATAVCGTSFAILQGIKYQDPDWEEYDSKYYFYNLNTQELKDGGLLEEGTYVYCGPENSNKVQIWDEERLRLTIQDTSDTSLKEVKDYGSFLPKGFENDCLYPDPQRTRMEDNQNRLYVTYRPGFACNKLDEKQGLYEIDVVKGTFERISTAEDLDEYDSLIYAPKD